MKRVSWFFMLCVWSMGIQAQNLSEKLRNAALALQDDVQMKHAMLGLEVINAVTGEKLIAIHEETGLAPASCQKIFTSIAAMELLGPDFRYTTRLGYDAPVSGNVLQGNLYLTGNGDPTLGSWRYDATKEDRQIQEMIRFLKSKGIKKISGNLIGENGKWDTQFTPNGWIWEDLGNYYGAGPAALNWHENQYDLYLRSGSRIGDKVVVLKTKPSLFTEHFDNELRSAAKGTGDQTDIYLAPYSQHGFLRGSIPVDEKAFVVSGSIPDP
ncbi:MAG: D-alanyl-D-alanine carboxypeptidase, partial [Bacteroidota bacterium]|nr:D-alanyl-D-alanine carboxypeptidase [Bacteroidota bacterium]